MLLYKLFLYIMFAYVYVEKVNYLKSQKIK